MRNDEKEKIMDVIYDDVIRRDVKRKIGVSVVAVCWVAALSGCLIALKNV